MLYLIKFSYVYDIKTNILISHRSVEVDFVICIDVLSAFTISVVTTTRGFWSYIKSGRVGSFWLNNISLKRKI